MYIGGITFTDPILLVNFQRDIQEGFAPQKHDFQPTFVWESLPNFSWAYSEVKQIQEIHH